jgi:hypothetical protein
MKIYLTYNGVTHTSKDMSDVDPEEMENFIKGVVKDEFSHLSFNLEDGGKIYFPNEVLKHSYIILK